MFEDTDLSRCTAAVNLEHLVCLLTLPQAMDRSLDLWLVLVLQFFESLVFQTVQHATVITLDHHLLRVRRDVRA